MGVLFLACWWLRGEVVETERNGEMELYTRSVRVPIDKLLFCRRGPPRLLLEALESVICGVGSFIVESLNQGSLVVANGSCAT